MTVREREAPHRRAAPPAWAEPRAPAAQSGRAERPERGASLPRGGPPGPVEFAPAGGAAAPLERRARKEAAEGEEAGSPGGAGKKAEPVGPPAKAERVGPPAKAEPVER